MKGENQITILLVEDEAIIARESARSIRDSHGQTLFYDGIVEDISERKRAEALRSRSTKARGVPLNLPYNSMAGESAWKQ